MGRIEGYLREAEALARKFNDQRRLASVSGYMSGLHLNTGGRASEVRAFADEVEAIGESLSRCPAPGRRPVLPRLARHISRATIAGPNASAGH